MKIPTGNFGFEVAQVQTGAAQVSNPGAVGESLTKLADTGMDIAKDMYIRQAQEQKKILDAQEKAKEEADKATAANVLVDTENGLADLHQEIFRGIEDGSIAKEQADQTWRQKSSELSSKFLERMPEAQRSIGQAQIAKYSGNLGRQIGTAVYKRNQQDTAAGLSSTLEGLERQAMADMPGSIERAEKLLDSVGPSAGFSAEEIQSKKQAFREKTSFTLAFDFVQKSRNDPKALSQIEEKLSTDAFAAIDPQKKSQLLSTISTYRTAIDQRSEAAANRAERERTRRMQSAEAAFNTFQALADKGASLSPEYIDQALIATTGTPYNAGIKEVALQAKEAGGIAIQPIRTQQAVLDEIDKKIALNGRSPELDKRREQISRVVNASKQDLNRDPLRAGLERGVITDIAPLDLSSPQGLVASISKRLQQADTISLWASKPISPLDSEEASQLRVLLGGLQPKDKSQAVAIIANAMPPKYASALAAQLDAQDRPLALAFSYSNSQTTGASNWLGRQTIAPRYTSELVLKGAQALKDGTVKTDPAKVSGWKAAISRSLEGVFPDANLAAATNDASFYVLAGLVSERNSGVSSSDDLEKAIKLAVGGDVVTHNNRKIPLPANYDLEQLDKRLRSITSDELQKQVPNGVVRAGGAEMPINDFLKSLPGQPLIYAGPGKYAVLVGGRPVVNTSGKPIVIGVQ